MTPVKTWLLLLLSVLFIAPTVSEVVTSMKDCGKFLLNNKPPQVPHVLENGRIKDNNRYKVICQTYNNMRRFVTLYDTKNKIPVLSAYKFTGATGKRPRTAWKIEPQLENKNDDKNMRNSQSVEYTNQAGDADYKGSGYDRGHLFPSFYAKTKDDKISTFTLTNAVPQVQYFNRVRWATMESRFKVIMESSCIDNKGDIEAYVMTGAQPNDSNTINNRVNVPSLLWSAFCCENKQNKWIAGAYWGKNVLYGPEQPLTWKVVYDEPKEKLKTEKNKFEAFPGSKCPLTQILSDLYPQMNQNDLPKRLREESQDPINPSKRGKPSKRSLNQSVH